MNSRDYWKKREDEARKNTIRDEQEYNKRLNEIYQYMIANIERQVNNWYANYASKEGITMAEARGRVRHIDMERYERLAAKYVATHDFSDQANEEMALYNLTMKVNRLELLKAEINLELMAGFDDIEHEMRRDLIETAMKEDRRLAGILGDSVIGNEQYAKQLVNASFRNATFSERIWGKNMPDLRVHLEAELRNGLVQGIGSQELARRFRKHYGGSVKDTERLMATEMCRLQTAVQKESFERNGYKEYMFITSGDESVCSVCQGLHGQHFKVSEMQAGVNAPPMHPRCHCSAASYMDSDKYKRWIDALARGEDVRWNEFEAEGGAEDKNADSIALHKESKNDKINPDSILMSQAVKDAETHEELGKILKSLGCVNVEGLETIPLESARYLTAGMQRANELFGQRIITLFEVKKGMQNYGEHHAVPSVIIIGRRRAEEDPLEAYFTALHESAHDYDHSRSSGLTKSTAYDYSQKIFKKALGNLGLTMRSKNGQALIYRIDHKWDKKDCSEAFAKAVEYGEAGKDNPLVKEIMRMLKEGEMP